MHSGVRTTDLSAFEFKLRNLKRAMKTLNKKRFSYIENRVSVTNNLLKVVHVHAMELLRNGITELIPSKQKETFIRMELLRNKINWLKEDIIILSFSQGRYL